MRVVSWYWLGILLAVVALAAVVLNGQPRYVPLVDRVQRTATLVGVALLFHVVPATFGVALGLWIRQRRDLLLRYRRAVAPVMWGFFGFALQLVVNMPLVGMAVCVGYSVVAGLSLCGMPGTHDQASGLLARRFRRVWIATGVMMGVGIVGG
ncbi:MAG TPA: hypothetical protein VHM90_00330 [Phycisphaerae bacterium]|nr:hypothetical protein [Phycisphaerae bacterium]